MAEQKPRYDYVNVPPAEIPVAVLDETAKGIMKEGTNVAGRIGMFARMAFFALYYFARKTAVEMEVARLKQQNEQDRQNHNQDTVDDAIPEGK